MSMLPILLLGGAALLIASKKKKPSPAEEEAVVPHLPPMPEEPTEPEFDPGEPAGPQVGDVIDSGIRRDRTGAHNWRILLGDTGYLAQDLPAGAHGPRDDLGVSDSVLGAKKILSDFYNEAVIESGYPNEVKDDPGIRTLAATSRLRVR